MSAFIVRLLLLAGLMFGATARAQQIPARERWWDDRVFYEIFVRSFADSTTGPLAGDGIGDIQGMIERLDYLNDGDPKTTTDLGITGIWLMPIHPSPSYHGYDITDYRAINPQYGTTEDFKRFLAECHKRGIAVIIDLVINHSSDKHPWFVEAQNPDSAKRDWYVWSKADPAWKGPWNQKVWHPSPSGFYFGLFYHGMPDLNFRSDSLTTEVFSMMDYWASEVKVDGFRLDAIRHLIEAGQVQENTPETHAWLKRMAAHLRTTAPRAMTIGEVWSAPKDVASYIGDELDLCFEFGLADA
ncbi:MAG: alpha-amylase family glycosyl hydrolase, partial [Phycisphaerales bacterium]